MQNNRTKTFKILLAVMALVAVAGFVRPFAKNIVDDSTLFSHVGVSGNVIATNLNNPTTTVAASATQTKNIVSKNSTTTENKITFTPTSLLASSTVVQASSTVIASTTEVISTKAVCFVSTVDYHADRLALASLGKKLFTISSSGCSVSPLNAMHAAVATYHPKNQIIYYAYPKNLGAIDYQDNGISTGIQVSVDNGSSYGYNNAWTQDSFTLTDSQGEQQIYYLYGYLFDGLLEPQNSNFIIKFP